MLVILFYSILFYRQVQAQDVPLHLVSWNIANLWHELDIALRLSHSGKRVAGRSAQDYTQLQHVITTLKADLLALQEIGSPQAARKLLEHHPYKIIFSPRFTTFKES